MTTLPVAVEPGTLSERGLRAFTDRLAAYPTVRIPGTELWAALAAAFPRRPNGPAERAWLLAALRHAEGEGAVALPPTTGRRWDRVAEPAVPTEVSRIRTAAAAESATWRSAVWHPALQWVPDLGRLTSDEQRFLRRVHDGLVRGTFRTPAPFKHRSLALTGDEKRLGDLVTGRLFAAGRLTLDLIGAIREVPPLAWTVIAPSAVPRVLVFENAGPSDLAVLLLRALADQNAHAYDAVVFGGGRTFPVAISRLRALAPASIAYVGDLDSDGLAIATTADAAARSAGLPPVVPAPGAHTAMLAAAVLLESPTGWLLAGRTRTTSAQRARPTELNWLPGDVREHVATILLAGRRIPEEALSPEAMRTLLAR